MKFPKLSPLQSRFAASLGASLILLIIYLSLTQPHFAYASELDSSTLSGNDNAIVLDDQSTEGGFALEDILLSAVNLEKRLAADILSLKNNEPQNKIINSGEIHNWAFPKEAIAGPAGERGKGLPTDVKDISKLRHAKLELKKRQSAKQVYITLNTCNQPLSTSKNSTDLSDLIPPQLLLYYSQSPDNSKPGPTSTGAQQNASFDSGYAIVNVTSDDTDIYVGIAAATAPGFTGSWNYEIAASIDAPFHSVDDQDHNLHFVDGDTHAALLITDDLTTSQPNETVYQEWMSMPPPFGMFGHSRTDPSILGLSKSYCGLMHNARIQANLQGVRNQNVADMTNRGLRAKPKEQFYVTFLNASSDYWGFLAMQGNSTASGLNVVGGGGKVWAGVNFSTKAESNCALMYNLSFCSEVAYAVPSNPNLFSPRDGLPELARLYDDHARTMYQYFNYSLQQIPCNTSASAQYSLARNCDDCARAYKQWLCAVTIPRCEDFTNNASYLKARNVAQPFPNGTVMNPIMSNPGWLEIVSTNQSRNALIDTQIRPGPYKEVLPCEDLCYDLVQSCPAALGFGCPTRGSGLQDSYGFRTSDGSEITCSYLGAAYYLSGGGRTVVESGTKWIAMVAVIAGLVMAL